MIQEYLVTKEEVKERISNFDEGSVIDVSKWKVKKTWKILQGTSSWMLTYELDSNNEDTARIMSKLHAAVCIPNSLTVLRDECSAYYNRRLYPLMNEFEHLLRMLLYTMANIHSDNQKATVIQNLEEKEFGALFGALFVDRGFCNSVKTFGNDNSWAFTKRALQEALNSIPEDTVWDAIIGETYVPTLKIKFDSLREIRNDIMHAHHVSHERFSMAKKLLDKINAELKTAIEEATDNKMTVSENYSEVLSAALQTLLSPELKQSIDEIQRNMSSALVSFAQGIPKVQPVLTEEVREQLQKITASYTEQISKLIGTVGSEPHTDD